MASELLKQFADELKSAREAKAIGLQHIAAKTKIDLKFLQAIEDANFELLPDIYIRAFIKEYASTIDLNPKEILQKYEIAKSGKIEEKPVVEVPQTKIDTVANPEIDEAKTNDSSEKKPIKKEFSTAESPAWQSNLAEVKEAKGLKTNYIIGGGIILIALVVIYFAFLSGSSNEIIQEKTGQETVVSDSERFEIEKPIQTQEQTQNMVNSPSSLPDSLRLSVLTTERVWVKVSTDGKIVQQQVVPANSKMNFAATKSFSLSVGNAGNVKVFFNNKPVENVGKPGEIRNLFITSDGIKYYTIPPQTNEKKPTTKN
ncbi:MAG: helix-turn-helix domain-containing protein [Ignavibacteriales bacterium]|nr:helix-turn-helix domain-containing protein [Ignavibacteriales bacterium]